MLVLKRCQVSLSALTLFLPSRCVQPDGLAQYCAPRIPYYIPVRFMDHGVTRWDVGKPTHQQRVSPAQEFLPCFQRLHPALFSAHHTLPLRIFFPFQGFWKSCECCFSVTLCASL